MLTADPMINIQRVRSRMLSGGHDVPKDKIIARYDKCLALVSDIVALTGIEICEKKNLNV